MRSKTGLHASALHSNSMKSGGSRSSLNSPLVNYALNGLQRCWLPEHGRWSHIFHLDGRNQPNESLARSDVFYSLNVLLGFSRVSQIPSGIDVPSVFERNVWELLRLPVSKYAFGMALWTTAELELEVPIDVARHIEMLLCDKKIGGTFVLKISE
jgi:hypothetical protein